ncbi:MAG: HEAT repeat domain-containing protein [Planctomycetota bacterium]
MSGKDIVFMIGAFLIGMLLISAFSTRPVPKQTATMTSVAAPNIQQVLPFGHAPLLAPLSDNYFVYIANDERFFICHYKQNTGLEIVEVYQLTYSPDRFATDLSKRKTHGWYFDAVSIEKLAVVRAKTDKFLQVGATDNWNAAEEAAKDLAASVGIAPLLEALKSEHYTARRAAAFALAEIGYLETVPVLAEVLHEKRVVRERAGALLFKLTKKDFLAEVHGDNVEPAVKKYLEWWKEQQK